MAQDGSEMAEKSLRMAEKSLKNRSESRENPPRIPSNPQESSRIPGIPTISMLMDESKTKKSNGFRPGHAEVNRTRLITT